jgi:hypothetical protein
MGTDWVSLFNRRICKEILDLCSTEMAKFVESHLDKLSDLSDFQCGFDATIPIVDRIDALQRRGRSIEELKEDLVEQLCVSSRRILIDYWACYAEVFVTDPPGSVPDYKLFPHNREQRYLILLPEHVDKMLSSLHEHQCDLEVMSDKEIAELRAWRDLAARDDGQAVAYFLD